MTGACAGREHVVEEGWKIESASTRCKEAIAFNSSESPRDGDYLAAFVVLWKLKRAKGRLKILRRISEWTEHSVKQHGVACLPSVVARSVQVLSWPHRIVASFDDRRLGSE